MDNYILPNEPFGASAILQSGPYVVYVKINNSDYITDINSSAFIRDTTGWCEIDCGIGDKYHHAQGNYFQQPIYTMGGAYRYKLMAGKPIECTAEEIAEQEKAIKSIPSQNDLIEAQIMYTAMMTDTLLTE